MNYRLPDSDYRIAFAARSADWAVDFASPEAPVGCKADSQWIPLDLSEGARLRELMTLVVLFKVLASKRHRYSVVHFFSSKVAVVGPLVACLARIPCIVTITGFGRIVVERRLRYRLLRRPYLAAVGIAMKLSRAVLFQNRADLNWSGARWPHLQSKFHYVGSATTSIPQRETPPSPPIRVVHVARLLRSKGILDFVDTAARFRGRGDIEFVLVGPPSYSEPDTLRKVQRAHREGILEYRGPLPPTNVAQVFREAHVLLFPSHGEGLSRVVLEAGAAGLCVIASDIAGNRDVVTAETGLLFPVGRPDRMAQLVEAVASDAVTRERLGAAIRVHILDRFTPEQYVERLDKVLRAAELS